MLVGRPRRGRRRRARGEARRVSAASASSRSGRCSRCWRRLPRGWARRSSDSGAPPSTGSSTGARPGPQGRRRGAGLLAQPPRGHRRGARGGGGGARPAGRGRRSSTARCSRSATAARRCRSRSTMRRFGRKPRRRGDARASCRCRPFFFDLPAGRRRRAHRPAGRGALRGARRRGARGARRAAAAYRRPRGGRRLPAPRPRPRPRGRDGQGPRSSRYAGRQPRRGAGSRSSPRTRLDLVVLAAEWGSGRRRGWLVQPPPRGARPRRRLRDARQDLQGHDRRACSRGRPSACWRSRSARDAAHRLRAPRAGGRDRLQRRPGRARSTPAASPCASPASSATGRTRRAAEADTFATVRDIHRPAARGAG